MKQVATVSLAPPTGVKLTCNLIKSAANINLNSNQNIAAWKLMAVGPERYRLYNMFFIISLEHLPECGEPLEENWPENTEPPSEPEHI